MKTQRTALPLAALLLALPFLFAIGCEATGKEAPKPATSATGQPRSTGARRIREKWYELSLTGDWNMDLQLLRSLAAVWHGMGDIGEILDTASRIRATSELSWYREWYATAERVSGMAAASLEQGHRVSAGEAYLRASNYYRAADFYLHADPRDTRGLDASRKSVASYARAVELLGLPVERVDVPFEGVALPGWFYKSPQAKGRAPVIIAHQGYDGTAEETQYVGIEAMKRGFNCLILDGPGQGEALRELGLKFRPDWEKVISAAVDYVVRRPEVDPERIAVLGISFGGSFVIRAAAFEHRPKIYIANPGSTNIARVFFERVDEKIVNLYREDPKGFNDAMQEAMRYSVAYRWFFNDGMWKFGVDSPAALVSALLAYDNTKYLDRVTSTVLVMDGADEIAGAGQAKALYDALRCPKDYLYFPREETGSLHSQNGALAVGTMRMFDWIEEHL